MPNIFLCVLALARQRAASCGLWILALLTISYVGLANALLARVGRAQGMRRQNPDPAMVVSSFCSSADDATSSLARSRVSRPQCNK